MATFLAEASKALQESYDKQFCENDKTRLPPQTPNPKPKTLNRSMSQAASACSWGLMRVRRLCRATNLKSQGLGVKVKGLGSKGFISTELLFEGERVEVYIYIYISVYT